MPASQHRQSPASWKSSSYCSRGRLTTAAGHPLLAGGGGGPLNDRLVVVIDQRSRHPKPNPRVPGKQFGVVTNDRVVRRPVLPLANVDALAAGADDHGGRLG